MKAFTYLTMRFSLRDRIYSFITNKETDQKARRLIWAFLNHSPNATHKNSKDLKKELKAAFTQSLEKSALAPWPLKGFVSAVETDNFYNQNILDILV